MCGAKQAILLRHSQAILGVARLETLCQTLPLPPASSYSKAQRRKHNLSLQICSLSCAPNLGSEYHFLLILVQNWSTFYLVDRTTSGSRVWVGPDHKQHPATQQLTPGSAPAGHHLLPTPFLPELPRAPCCAPAHPSCPSYTVPSWRSPHLPTPPSTPGSKISSHCFSWSLSLSPAICTSITELFLLCLVSLHQNYLCTSALRIQPCLRWEVFSFSRTLHRFASKGLVNLKICQVIYWTACNTRYAKPTALWACVSSSGSSSLLQIPTHDYQSHKTAKAHTT